jgi:hypothetical protein
MEMPSFSKRQFLQGAVTLCTCICTRMNSAYAKRLSENAGCALIGTDSILIDRTKVSAANASAGDFGEIAHSSGNRDWDIAFDKALKRIADVFGVMPTFAFYDDSSNQNAWAQSAQPYSIYFGKNLFNTVLEMDPSGISAIQISAHEFGHIHQYASGIYRNLKSGQPTSKRVELHADFLSGYYLGLLKADHPTASFWRAGSKIYEFGDYGYNNPTHHGTPEDRVAAAEAGFRLSYFEKKDFNAASQLGVEYVSK